jgi:hypothetical protein
LPFSSPFFIRTGAEILFAQSPDEIILPVVETAVGKEMFSVVDIEREIAVVGFPAARR